VQDLVGKLFTIFARIDSIGEQIIGRTTRDRHIGDSAALVAVPILDGRHPNAVSGVVVVDIVIDLCTSGFGLAAEIRTQFSFFKFKIHR
jgi:hypothetical protein